MKRGTPDHPKTHRLARALGVPRAQAAGHLEFLWHWTAKFAPRGDVGRFQDQDIEQGAGWEGPPGALVRAFEAEGWLCPHPEPEVRLVVHDWHEHAEDAVKKALQRRGETFIICPANVRRCPPLSGHSPTSADNGSLPKPLPLPEPEPQPAAATVSLPVQSQPEGGCGGEAVAPLRGRAVQSLGAGALELARMRLAAAARRLAALPFGGGDVGALLGQASRTKDGAAFTDPDRCSSVAWLQVTEDRLDAIEADNRRRAAQHGIPWEPVLTAEGRMGRGPPSTADVCSGVEQCATTRDTEGNECESSKS